MEPPSLDLTLGAFQIGILVSYMLFGVLTAQIYMYFTRFPEDSAKMKAFVICMWICEAGHAICSAAALYSYTITSFGDPESLLHAPPVTLPASVFLSGIISGSVQGFFAYRIYALSMRLYLPCACWVLGFVRFVGGIVVFATGVGAANLTSFYAQWGWLLTIVWSVGAANDVMIAVALAFLLHRQRRNAHTRTIQLMNKLLRWTIETGLLTSAATSLILVFFYAMKETFIFLAFFVVASRLYSNTLLASLNSRATLREMNDSVVQSHNLSSTINFPSTGVHVSQTTTVMNGSGSTKDAQEL